MVFPSPIGISLTIDLLNLFLEHPFLIHIKDDLDAQRKLFFLSSATRTSILGSGSAIHPILEVHILRTDQSYNIQDEFPKKKPGSPHLSLIQPVIVVDILRTYLS